MAVGAGGGGMGGAVWFRCSVAVLVMMLAVFVLLVMLFLASLLLYCLECPLRPPKSVPHRG
jgi:hypothetical protein